MSRQSRLLGSVSFPLPFSQAVKYLPDFGFALKKKFHRPLWLQNSCQFFLRLICALCALAFYVLLSVMFLRMRVHFYYEILVNKIKYKNLNFNKSFKIYFFTYWNTRSWIYISPAMFLHKEVYIYDQRLRK